MEKLLQIADFIMHPNGGGMKCWGFREHEPFPL